MYLDVCVEYTDMHTRSISVSRGIRLSAGPYARNPHLSGTDKNRVLEPLGPCIEGRETIDLRIGVAQEEQLDDVSMAGPTGLAALGGSSLNSGPLLSPQYSRAP